MDSTAFKVNGDMLQAVTQALTSHEYWTEDPPKMAEIDVAVVFKLVASWAERVERSLDEPLNEDDIGTVHEFCRKPFSVASLPWKKAQKVMARALVFDQHPVEALMRCISPAKLGSAGYLDVLDQASLSQIKNACFELLESGKPKDIQRVGYLIHRYYGGERELPAKLDQASLAQWVRQTLIGVQQEPVAQRVALLEILLGQQRFGSSRLYEKLFEEEADWDLGEELYQLFRELSTRLFREQPFSEWPRKGKMLELVLSLLCGEKGQKPQLAKELQSSADEKTQQVGALLQTLIEPQTAIQFYQAYQDMVSIAPAFENAFWLTREAGFPHIPLLDGPMESEPGDPNQLVRLNGRKLTFSVNIDGLLYLEAPGHRRRQGALVLGYDIESGRVLHAEYLDEGHIDSCGLDGEAVTVYNAAEQTSWTVNLRSGERSDPIDAGAMRPGWTHTTPSGNRWQTASHPQLHNTVLHLMDPQGQVIQRFPDFDKSAVLSEAGERVISSSYGWTGIQVFGPDGTSNRIEDVLDAEFYGESLYVIWRKWENGHYVGHLDVHTFREGSNELEPAHRSVPLEWGDEGQIRKAKGKEGYIQAVCENGWVVLDVARDGPQKEPRSILFVHPETGEIYAPPIDHNVDAGLHVNERTGEAWWLDTTSEQNPLKKITHESVEVISEHLEEITRRTEILHVSDEGRIFLVAK